MSTGNTHSSLSVVVLTIRTKYQNQVQDQITPTLLIPDSTAAKEIGIRLPNSFACIGMMDHDESVISEFKQELTSKAAANDVLRWATDHNVDVTKIEELIYYYYEFRDAVGGVDASPLVCVRYPVRLGLIYIGGFGRYRCHVLSMRTNLSSTLQCSSFCPQHCYQK